MAKILVVDDTPVDLRLVGGLLEQNGDLKAIYAGNGKEALDVIDRECPELVLTDLQMPDMNGLELVRRIRKQHPAIPVILMTAFGSEDVAIKALQQGAAHYVPKANLANDLLDVVESVLAAAVDLRLQARAFAGLLRTEAHFRLENDIALIASLVNYLRENLARVKMLDETALIRVTVALREALMNAIVHGNLNVSSDLREHDLADYYNQIETRRNEAAYRERRVHLSSKETPVEVRYVIRDEGLGFNPAKVPDPTLPENMEKASGRGLLLINTFMDEVRHNPSGNEITMVKRRDGRP